MKKLFLFLAILFCSVPFLCSCAKEEPIEIVHVTDIHFAGREYHDYEGIFMEDNDSNGTGKQMKYLDDILDAFIDEMLERKPDYILLTGDNTYIGAEKSHLLLTEKLKTLTAEGITILTVPGNHDITKYAFIFPDGKYEAAGVLTPESFREVYSEFGYNGGVSYHDKSLSYVYDTGKSLRIFMLDTNFMYGVIYGQLDESKMEWFENELKACSEAGDKAIICGHHNLLDHNKLFSIGYKLDNSPDVEELLKKYDVDLYLSGHMHTQHISWNENVTDIVGGAFSVYPHRYGVIEFTSEGWNYNSHTTDVEAFAKKIGSDNPDLLNYSDYGYAFFYNNAYAQAMESLAPVITDEALLEKYADFSAQLNVAYFGGTFSDVDLSVAEDFLRDSEGTRWGGYMQYVLEDTKDSIEHKRPLTEE